jgi:hypothetical protein
MTYREIADKLHYEHEFRPDTKTLRNLVAIWDPTLSSIEEDEVSEDQAKVEDSGDIDDPTEIGNLSLQNTAVSDTFLDDTEMYISDGVLDQWTGPGNTSPIDQSVPAAFNEDAVPREVLEQRFGESMIQPSLDRQSSGSKGSDAPKTDGLTWWEDYSVIAPPPPSTPEWDTARQDLFRYLKKRWEILNVERQCGELQHEILQTRNKQLVRGSGTEIQPILEKLFHLQETEAECRQRLLTTKLEPILIEKIDLLLSSAQAKPESRDNDRKQLKYRRDLRAKLSAYSNPATQPPSCAASSTSGSLDDYDDHISEFVGTQFLEGVSLSRFQSSLRAFLDATERRIVHYLPGEGRQMRLTPNDIRPLERLQDDLCHAHFFFRLIKADLPNQRSDEIEQAWLRIIAVIALCYGCTADPAFLLSTLDRLLDDLRSAFGELVFAAKN